MCRPLSIFCPFDVPVGIVMVMSIVQASLLSAAGGFEYRRSDWGFARFAFPMPR
jgi:hypothetical protein